MSDLNISKLRQRLMNYERSYLGPIPPNIIADTIKLCNMFEALEQSCHSYDIGMVPELQLHRTIEHFKELYFPSYVTKTIKVNVKVGVDEGLARVYQIKNAIEQFTKKRYLDVEGVTYE